MEWIILALVLVATVVLQELLRPPLPIEDARPSGLGDFSFPTATEGRVIPLVFGTVKIKGPNVTWYGDLRQEAIKERLKTGLFTSQTIVKGFKYRVGLQFSLCHGPVDELLRVWIGEKIIFSGSLLHDQTFSFDSPNLFGGDDLGSGGASGTMRFFAGTTTQLPSTYLSQRRAVSATVGSGGTGYVVGEVLTLVGGTGTAAKFKVTSVSSGAVVTVVLNKAGSYSAVPVNPAATTSAGLGTGCTLNVTYTANQGIGGRVPAYRGTCYLAPDSGPIYVGNSTSIRPWAFEVRRIPNGLNLSIFQKSVNGGNDANPMNVIFEAMTDDDWGLDIDPALIDTSNFTTAALQLLGEGNGFSMTIDRKTEAGDLIKLVEGQIDGVVFFNHVVGKFQVNLIRGGYDVGSLTTLDSSNSRITNFARGAWEETTNVVYAKFVDRTDDYKDTSGVAHDGANVKIQGGTTVVSERSYPGVKDRTLANQIAWRVLRTLSTPLARATVVTDRSLHGIQPGNVVLLTDAEDAGFSQIPMRVISIDYGELEDGEIKLELVQDVFIFRTGSFADPSSSGWSPPSDNLLPFDDAEQLAIEAPRAFLSRDPDFEGFLDKLWAGARKKGPEVSYKIVERHSSGTPSGAFSEVGEVFGFLLIGTLQSNLPAGSPKPLTSLTLTASPDVQADLEAAFQDSGTLQEKGSGLVNLVLVGSEFMLPESAQNVGPDVRLNNLYRGLLDTVQAPHSAGDPVFLVFVGGGLSEGTITSGQNVHVKLLPRSLSAQLPEASATQVALTMSNRLRRPYPPSTLRLGGTVWASTASLEGSGSTPETFAVALSVRRRDFRLADSQGDEIAALDNDAPNLFSDFPSANQTDHQVDVRNDPDGANTFLFTDTFPGASQDVLRLKILKGTGGVIPSRLRFVVRSRHVLDSVTHSSLQEQTWDFNVTSALSGQFNFGALGTNVVSNIYTATANGTYSFTLSSAFASGTVQYRINAGAFQNLITAGNTVGSIPGVISGQTIEVRHTSTEVGALKQLSMTPPAGTSAYAVLFV